MAPNLQRKKQMKKTKPKSGSHKASAGKLANKKTSRLARQGKLNKAEKRKKRKQSIQDSRQKEQKNEQVALNGGRTEDNEEPDESEFSDENTEFFQHLKNAREFAKLDLSHNDLRGRGKKRKKDSDDEEEVYEQQPRSFASEKENEKLKMLLPIIDKGRVIKQVTQTEGPDNDDAAEKDSKDLGDKAAGDAKEEMEEKASSDNAIPRPEEDEKMLASLTPAQLFAYRKNKIASAKQTIAALAQGVLEDPQNNMKKLKELRQMLGDSSPGVCLTVRKYAALSLMEVFKDIVPGYRLRIPTEKEAAQRVKKETKSLWDYEASFLLSYRIYLTFLQLMAKGKPIPEKSFLTKHGIANLSLPAVAQREFSKLCLKCLCEMLINHPHFNYRGDIISTIVPIMNHSNQKFSDLACEAVKTVFKQDRAGDVTLEIVKTIGRMAKKLEFDMQPQILQTFLVLKIKEIDLSTQDEQKKMLKKEKMLKFSRRERKRLKQKEQLDRELLETKAAADKQQKLKMHTEIIQAVFETYIRVIKTAADSVLLPAVLEGLARFAHLINIEYFDSLFSALNSLIESQVLTDREMLHCLQTAFTILTGQGTVINIDPSRFYKHFYAALLSVHAGQSSEMTPIVLECLNTMIHKRRKQMSQHRVLAFIKRLASLCLQQSPESTIAFLAAIRQFLHAYKYSDILLDTETRGSGVYLPELEDPEHCCANTTALWELHLLRRHYDPSIQSYSRHVLYGAPVAGEHQLKQDLARRTPMELYESFSNMNIFNQNIPEKPAKRKKLRPAGDFVSEDFGSYVMSVYKSMPQPFPANLSQLIRKRSSTKT
ncbi:nucleolar complex protein 3 homolog [Plakobranchus ocellatus]|uniref:Nucleolar complex protein 3 homolog n=1 Tax=Plakobranchus ocellatus TaxID=259542 RepID=A0AAV4CW85_9GAST|nr:nucleolar complex protein 3 homolog [Plakobranchus ocellatus]